MNKIGLGLLLLLTTSLFAQENPQLQLGGALRFNYSLCSWKEGQVQRGGDFGYDVFYLESKARYKGIELVAEYRFYALEFGGPMLKKGWLAYDFNPKDEVQVGQSQVPFGIIPYNSNSYFFSLNYYIGLEDDHDMGVRYLHRGDKWDIDLAFYKNAEDLVLSSYGDLSGSRYAYDVASIDLDGDGQLELRNKEVNQLNARTVYKIKKENTKQELGVSAQYGALQNLDTKKLGSHCALSAHYQLTAKKLDIKAQVSHYHHKAQNPDGQPTEVIAMTAYDAPYTIAAEGSTITLGVAYTFPVSWGPISSIQVYNDLGYLHKEPSHFEDSWMNVSGAFVTAGKVYTYIDLAMGKNQPWIGGAWTEGLAEGANNAPWEAQFNICMGYYF